MIEATVHQQLKIDRFFALGISHHCANDQYQISISDVEYIHRMRRLVCPLPADQCKR